MKIKLILFLLTIMTSAFCVSAETAVDVVKHAAAKITGSQSANVGFTMSQPGQGATSGKMTISGNRFVIDTPQLAIWFDGKTQWTLSKANKETTVTVPDGDDLRQTNPLIVFNEFHKRYNAAFLKSNTGNKVVKLTAKAKNDPIPTIVITFNGKTAMPTQLVLTLSNRTTLNLKITDFHTAGKPAASVFVYDAKKHPGVEIIDLR